MQRIRNRWRQGSLLRRLSVIAFILLLCAGFAFGFTLAEPSVAGSAMEMPLTWNVPDLATPEGPVDGPVEIGLPEVSEPNAAQRLLQFFGFDDSTPTPIASPSAGPTQTAETEPTPGRG